MSDIMDFIAGNTRPPKEIINYWSDGGNSFTSSYISTAMGKNYLSGALVADTLKSIFSLPGTRGIISYMGVQSVDGTSREIGVRVTIDGVVVFNAATAATARGLYGPVLVGGFTGAAGAGGAGGNVPFSNSLQVEVSSSVAAGETDTVNLVIAYTVI